MEDSKCAYLVDNVSMTKDEWYKRLDRDIDTVQTKNKQCDIKHAVYTDINNGHDIIVNQHQYARKFNDNHRKEGCV